MSSTSSNGTVGPSLLTHPAALASGTAVYTTPFGVPRARQPSDPRSAWGQRWRSGGLALGRQPERDLRSAGLYRAAMPKRSLVSGRRPAIRPPRTGAPMAPNSTNNDLRSSTTRTNLYDRVDRWSSSRTNMDQPYRSAAEDLIQGWSVRSSRGVHGDRLAGGQRARSPRSRGRGRHLVGRALPCGPFLWRTHQ